MAKTPRLQNQFGPTQHNVAEALGLSQSTVALALNPKHQHRLSEETVARIQAKAEEMGYRPQRFARILRNGRSHAVGAIYNSGYHPSQERVKFLAQYAIQTGFQLLAVDMQWFGNDERAAQDYLLGSALEGAILCNITGEFENEWATFLKSRNIPVLALSSSVAGGMERACVDMALAFQGMTEHHLSTGARRLALLLPYHDPGYLGWPGDSIMQRVQGFKTAILASGGVVEAEPSLYERLEIAPAPKPARAKIRGLCIHPEKTDAFDDMFELGHYQAETMILEGKLPDSLICSNDEIAVGALAACRKHGVRVPGTVRISGADNARFSRFCGAPLTTIEQPSKEMTEYCIQRIVELIEDPSQREQEIHRSFACRLLVRESTVADPVRPAAEAPGQPISC